LTRQIRSGCAFVLAAMCAACTGMGDPAGFSVVTQDKFDFSTCPEILANRTALSNRERELAGLVQKAESAPGGVIVSYTAYRSELTSTRAQREAADRAAQLKGCEAAKPKR
jgi:hypothetical protein